MSRKRLVAGFLSVFCAGLVGGAIGMNVLEMRVRATNTAVALSLVRNAQEFRAVQAELEGDHLSALGHRWTALNLASSRQFEFLDEYCGGFWHTFKLLEMEKAMASDDFARNRTASEGIYRGRLAVHLDALGYQERASSQWEQAEALVGVASRDDMKAMMVKMSEYDTDPTVMRLNAEIFGAPERAK